MPPSKKKLRNGPNNGPGNSKNPPKRPWNKQNRLFGNQRRLRKEKLLQAMSDELNNFGEEECVPFPSRRPPEGLTRGSDCSRSPFHPPRYSKERGHSFLNNRSGSRHPDELRNINQRPRSPLDYPKTLAERYSHSRKGYEHWDNKRHPFNEENRSYTSSERNSRANWGSPRRSRSPYDRERHSGSRGRGPRDSHRLPYDPEMSRCPFGPDGSRNRDGRDLFEGGRSPSDDHRHCRARGRNENRHFGGSTSSFGSPRRDRGNWSASRSPFDCPRRSRSRGRDFGEGDRSYDVEEADQYHFDPRNMDQKDYPPQNYNEHGFSERNIPYDSRFPARDRSRSYDRCLPSPRRRSNHEDHPFMDTNDPCYDPRRSPDPTGGYQLPRYSRERSFSPRKDSYGGHQSPYYSETHSNYDYRGTPEHYDLYQQGYHSSRSPSPYYSEENVNFSEPQRYERDQFDSNEDFVHSNEPLSDRTPFEGTQGSNNYEAPMLSPQERPLLHSEQDYNPRGEVLDHRRSKPRSFGAPEDPRGDYEAPMGSTLPPERRYGDSKKGRNQHLDSEQDYDRNNQILDHRTRETRSFKASGDPREDYGVPRGSKSPPGRRYGNSKQNKNAPLDSRDDYEPRDHVLDHRTCETRSFKTSRDSREVYGSSRGSKLPPGRTYGTTNQDKNAPLDCRDDYKPSDQVLDNRSPDLRSTDDPTINQGHFDPKKAQWDHSPASNDSKRAPSQTSNERKSTYFEKYFGDTNEFPHDDSEVSDYSDWGNEEKDFRAKNTPKKRSKPFKDSQYCSYSLGRRRETSEVEDFVKKRLENKNGQTKYDSNKEMVQKNSEISDSNLKKCSENKQIDSCGKKGENLNFGEHNLQNCDDKNGKLNEISEKPRRSGAARRKIKHIYEIEEMKKKFGKVFFEKTGAPNDYFEKNVPNAYDIGWGGKKNKFGILINKKSSEFIIVPIIWDTYPNKKINNIQAEIIKEYLIAKMSETDSAKPKFQSIKLDNGALIANCIDEDTVEWLETILPQCPHIGKHFLRAVRVSQIHKAKVMVYVPGLHRSGKEFLAHLEQQNPDFTEIKSWKCLSADSYNENESRYVLQMSVDCWNKLLKRNKTLYYHFTYLKFMILFKNKKDRARMKALFREAKLETQQRNKEKNYGITKIKQNFQMTTRSMKSGTKRTPGTSLQEEQTPSSASGTNNVAPHASQSSIEQNLGTETNFEAQSNTSGTLRIQNSTPSQGTHASFGTYGEPSGTLGTNSDLGIKGIPLDQQGSSLGTEKRNSTASLSGAHSKLPSTLGALKSALSNLKAFSSAPSTLGTQNTAPSTLSKQSSDYGSSGMQPSASFSTLGTLGTKGYTTSTLEPQGTFLGGYRSQINTTSTLGMQSTGYGTMGAKSSGSFSTLGTKGFTLGPQGSSLGTYRGLSSAPSALGTSYGYASSGMQSSASYGILGTHSAVGTWRLAPPGTLGQQNSSLGSYGRQNNAPSTLGRQFTPYGSSGPQSNTSFGTLGSYSALGTRGFATPGTFNSQGSYGTQNNPPRTSGTLGAPLGASGNTPRYFETEGTENYYSSGAQNLENSGPSNENNLEVYY